MESSACMDNNYLPDTVNCDRRFEDKVETLGPDGARIGRPRCVLEFIERDEGSRSLFITGRLALASAEISRLSDHSLSLLLAVPRPAIPPIQRNP